MKLLPLGLALLVSAPAIASDWTIDPAASSITFTTTIFNRPLEGSFGEFEANISLDPADLSTAQIEGRVMVASGETGNSEYDSEMTGRAGLDARRHPLAIFASSEIRTADVCADGVGDCYLAVGTLTIAGDTQPASLPFRLVIDGDRAIANGELTVERDDFGVGGAEWDNAAETVQLHLHIEATR